jgi:hypothetical protein
VIEPYFNYFTEAEQHFQRQRGTGLFLFSPLDWTLLETWKNQGIPLEAVLRGIHEAFEKWRRRKTKTKVQMVNSLAYCAQEVAREAEAMAQARPSRREAAPPFTLDELKEYLVRNARVTHERGSGNIGKALDELAANADSHYSDLEQLEQRLTVLEEKMIASLRAVATEEALLGARRELELQLKPYRGKMTAEQIATLQQQFLDRRLLEDAGLPRLSLFYL